MKIKNIITAFIASYFIMSQPILSAFTTVGTEPLQAYFSEDGTIMKIFTSSPLSENAEVLIGNETLDAEIMNIDVQIRTTFLIDNSTSMPYSLRNEITTAISDYVSIMPTSESVKIAIFDTQTTVLADEYSSDLEFINYELSKVDFKGKASLVYDSIMNTVNSTDNNQDVYYRTVLITDGVDSVEGTSFDYMQNVISENGRYHIDVVQVSEGNKQDVNLTAIANLGSNTYTFFNSGTKFDTLVPRNVSLMKINLTNSVTTGELKGVTIKNGTSSITLGSILFPQVEIAPPETETEEETIIETTEVIETEKNTEATVTEIKTEKKKGSPLMIVLIVIGVLAVAGTGTAVFFFIKSKKTLICNVSVQITKDDNRDQDGTGSDVWAFPITSEFRVGRTLEPIADDRKPLPKNHRAICENATNEDISSIGRNAFVLTYDNSTNALTITNIAKSAMFSVETTGEKKDIRKGQSTVIVKNSKILIGNYTTVTIHNITVNHS